MQVQYNSIDFVINSSFRKVFGNLYFHHTTVAKEEEK